MMKRIVSLVTMMMTASVVAMERQQLMPLIEAAATNRESAYVETRNKIVECGKDALPILSVIAADESLTWQQQLVACICHERIERKKDIADLLATDWYKHPDIDPNWSPLVIGTEGYIGHYIISPALNEMGLWYYYLELEWKTTGEVGKIRDFTKDGYWTRLCTATVKDSPEKRTWFLRVFDDLIETTPPPPRLHKLCNELLHDGKPDTADVLKKYRTKYPPRPLPPPVPGAPRTGMRVTKPATEN